MTRFGQICELILYGSMNSNVFCLLLRRRMRKFQPISVMPKQCRHWRIPDIPCGTELWKIQISLCLYKHYLVMLRWLYLCSMSEAEQLFIVKRRTLICRLNDCKRKMLVVKAHALALGAIQIVLDTLGVMNVSQDIFFFLNFNFCCTLEENISVWK